MSASIGGEYWIRKLFIVVKVLLILWLGIPQVTHSAPLATQLDRDTSIPNTHSNPDTPVRVEIKSLNSLPVNKQRMVRGYVVELLLKEGLSVYLAKENRTVVVENQNIRSETSAVVLSDTGDKQSNSSQALADGHVSREKKEEPTERGKKNSQSKSDTPINPKREPERLHNILLILECEQLDISNGPQDILKTAHVVLSANLYRPDSDILITSSTMTANEAGASRNQAINKAIQSALSQGFSRHFFDALEGFYRGQS